MNCNVMIAGVGGQGSLLASRILGNAAIAAGLDVKVSEIHGMSQRGGSVVTYVKMGDKIHSPLVENGECDFLLCFERLEALRYVGYVRPAGTLFVNDQRIDPITVITGAAQYPDDVAEQLKDRCPDTVVLDAAAIALQCGDIRAVNVVLIGCLARRIAIDKPVWLEVIKATVPARALEVNLRAFEEGYAIGQ